MIVEKSVFLRFFSAFGEIIFFKLLTFFLE